MEYVIKRESYKKLSEEMAMDSFAIVFHDHL